MLDEMLNEPVSRFTNHHMTTIDVGLTVSDAAKAMVETKSDSILIYTNYNVIGIVTLKDILNKIVAEGKDPTKTTIGVIASKPIIKIHKDAKVREAIDLMKKNDIRRLVVMNDERPIGLISQKALVGNMNEYDTPLPELEIPDKVMCPYCQSVFANKHVLSKHIDQIHIGKGLLEGNLVKAKI
jgi:signal-transduction protein with cAMP-binding, CBS, and nucleotidyltransferase domain